MSLSLQIIAKTFPVILAIIGFGCIYFAFQYETPIAGIFGGFIILLAAFLYYYEIELEDDYRRKYPYR
jgi:hypothetical protein